MLIESLDDRRERCWAPLSEAELPAVDPVTLEIVSNRLNAIAAEMGVSLLRTAHSILFAESKDFSCALFDVEGHMISMAEYLPAHQGGMQSSLTGVIREVGLEAFREGDIFMVNDALYGASHSQDLTLFAPVHYRGQLVAIAGNLMHHIDMGGMAPSSYCPNATEIYQEGIRFPPTTRLFEKGELRRDILNILLTNIRCPEAQRGDLFAQVAAGNTARRRLDELCEKYGPQVVRDVCRLVKHHTAERTRSMIAELVPGKYRAEDFVDGDGLSNKAYRIRCQLAVQPGKLVFDFTGSDNQAPGFVNSYWGSTAASVYVAVMCHLALEVPKNYGVFVPVEIIAEKGTIVNPDSGAPLGACTTEPGHVITDVAHACLGQAHPSKASGSWGGNLGVHNIWGKNPRTGKPFVGVFSDAMGVGGGGRNGFDGWHPASLRGSHVTLPNVEIVENEYPILYRYRRLVNDAETGGAGAGKFRGGSSVAYEIAPLGGLLSFSLVMGRFQHPPLGIFGGKPGSLSRVEIYREGELKNKINSKTVGQVLEPGDSLLIVPPCGGGYGPPFERDPQMVREDVLLGYSTLQTARDVYGVVLDPVTLEILWEETKRARSWTSKGNQKDTF